MSGEGLIKLLLALHGLLDHIQTVTLEPVKEAVKTLHERVAAEVEADDN